MLKAYRLVQNAWVILTVGFGLVIAAAIATIILVAKSEEADRLVAHTFRVGQEAQSLIGELRAAENGQRGYILTLNESYLAPVREAVAKVPGLLDSLKTLTGDNAVQQARLDRLRPLIDERVAFLEKNIQRTLQGEREAATAAIATGAGKALMDDVLAEMSRFQKSESELLHRRQETSKRLRFWLAALIAGALLSALLLAGLLAVATRQAVSGLIERTRELETESKLRREAESTLRQAQKMEAVGQLTGGIAHDFNNLLTIIIGNLDTMKRALAKALEDRTDGSLGAKLLKPLDAATAGADRAAQLTHRLLAFSRRQTLEPTRLDLNRLVTDMLDLLRRSLGADISIETVLSAGLWPTFADAHQVENALLNLTLNARAAMPEGGHLTIETSNAYLDDGYAHRFGDLASGQYVLLCVSDTGAGMSQEVLDRVFEPFFTTKPQGEGSGLGLAMVHGFVKQSGGHVRIYSEEGHGTAVKIYLPRLIGGEISAVPPPRIEAVEIDAAPRANPGETILVVEDNVGVRDYAKEVLSNLGYRVLEAGDAAEALRQLSIHPQTDLLFTDVVLPGSVTGRALADKAKEMHPGLPVLFTTGYTRNAIVHQGRLDPDVQLLNKPYTQQTLARKIRALLDEAKTATGKA